MSVESLLSQILAELKGGGGGGGSTPEEAAEKVTKEEEARIKVRRDEEIRQLKERQELSAKIAEGEQKATEKLRLQIDAAEDLLKLERARVAAGEDRTGSVTDAIAGLKVLRRQLKEIPEDPFEGWWDTTKLQKMRKATAVIGDMVLKLNSGATMAGAMDESFTGLVRAATNLDALGVASALVKSLINVTVSAVAEVDRLRAQFVAATGETEGAKNMFINLTLANHDLALSFEQVMGAQLALREGFVDFVFLSQSVRESLTLQAATMEKLGINVDTTGDTINTLTHAFGMNHRDAIQMQRDMVGLGIALGRPPKVIAEEFNKALPSLAMFGSRAIEVFEDIQMAARATSLSVDSITSTFGDSLNTYEDAVRLAGNLNAVLGRGTLSATRLLMATNPAERLEQVREAVGATGKVWADMGEYERIAVQRAAGFRSVDEAARAFGETQEEVVARIGDTNITEADMAKLAKEATDSMMQLKYAFSQMAIAIQPLAEGFAIIIDKFIEFGNTVPGGVGGLASGLTAAAGAVAIAMSPLTGGTSVLPGIAMLGTGGLGIAGTAMGGTSLDDGEVTFTRSDGVKDVVPVNSADEGVLLLGKAGGPFSQAMSGAPAAATPAPGEIAAAVKSALQPALSNLTKAFDRANSGTGKDIVLKASLNGREIIHALGPLVDNIVLGK